MGRKVFWGIVSLQLLIIAVLSLNGAESLFTGQETYKFEPGEIDRNYREEIEYRNYSQVLERRVRIVVLGDSFTAGFGLRSREYAWPDVLEDRLREEGRGAEIINLGVPGTGIEHHADRFTERGYRYEPHLLLLQVNRGDYYNYSRFEEIVSQKLEQENLTDAPREERGALREETWKEFVEQEENRSKSYKIERFRRNFNRIAAKTGNGTKVFLVYMPRTPNNYEPRDFFRSYSEKNGWEFVDGREFYSGVPDEKVRLDPGDPHFNRYGNMIWAEKVQERIEDDVENIPEVQ